MADYAATNGGQLFVMLSPDQLAKGQIKAPNGVAWSDILADFNTLGGSVPVPSPALAPAPTPSPAGTVPTLALAQQWAGAGIAAGEPLQTRAQAITAAYAGLEAAWPKATS
jgi:hypothetical protein